MKHLMISAMHSGAGKTTLTCALLLALKKRGLHVRGLKCGPDYIDPMFHAQALGVPSGNLDLFLQGPERLKEIFSDTAADVTLLEGAMGFYDGLGGTTSGSAWEIACMTDTPAVLVLRPSGQSITLAAQIRGMQTFREESHIAGLILTDCKASLEAHLHAILEQETGLKVLGYLPPAEAARFPARHLGLCTPAELEDIEKRLNAVADMAAENIDLGALLQLARESPSSAAPHPDISSARCRIAVARDTAFCFYYADCLDILKQAGAELVYFSPLADAALPPDCHGLYLGGGYPEVFAERLSRNTEMRESIRRAVTAGMPTVAECGGFLYLQQELEGEDGIFYPMASALPGRGFRTDHLQHFGYVLLRPDRDSLLFRAGESVPAHEFHYWDSTESGRDLPAVKPLGRSSRRCGVAGRSVYAAFPHLCLDNTMAARFAGAAVDWKEHRR